MAHVTKCQNNGNETKQMLAERRLLMPAINFITSSYPKSSFWRHSKLCVEPFLLWEVSWIVQNPQCQTVLLGISTNHMKTTSWPLSSDLTSFLWPCPPPLHSLHLSLKLLLISIILLVVTFLFLFFLSPFFASILFHTCPCHILTLCLPLHSNPWPSLLLLFHTSSHQRLDGKRP